MPTSLTPSRVSRLSSGHALPEGGYRSPLWLPGGHLQTIWSATLVPQPDLAFDQRIRWDTPDGDFIDLDRIMPLTPSAPHIVLFHGLEGSSSSHYAQALMRAVARRGWAGTVVHFRGCSGEPNRLPRAYHSGDSAEIDWILRRLREQRPEPKANDAAHAPGHQDGREPSHGHPPRGPVWAVGVSLGGNALTKWLGEQGDAARQVLEAAAVVSAPLDLAAGAESLRRGVSRVYLRMFLNTLIPKALAKLADHPGLIDAEAVRRARDFHAFDTEVTARLHGFKDCWDYWHRCSGRQFLPAIRLPTLMLNARNDPFLPACCLPGPHEVQAGLVRLEQPQGGGHVGFASGGPPGHLDWLPERLLRFFEHG